MTRSLLAAACILAALPAALRAQGCVATGASGLMLGDAAFADYRLVAGLNFRF